MKEVPRHLKARPLELQHQATQGQTFAYGTKCIGRLMRGCNHLGLLELVTGNHSNHWAAFACCRHELYIFTLLRTCTCSMATLTNLV